MRHKHPRSLIVFFTTEMWERYGFYVVQTLLALYLAFFYKWSDDRAYALVGSFTALTYLSPLLGGWIADHFIGQKKAILTAIMVLFVSYIGLGFIVSDHGLAFSLAGVAVGTGLMKPNISSLLGNEYPTGSPHRESGFTIFYMGITTGIIIGTTLPSYLNHHFHWSIAFLSASVGMILALGVFISGLFAFHIKDYRPHELNLKNFLSAATTLLTMWISAYYILINPKFANSIFAGVVVLTVLYILHTMWKEPAKQAKRTLIILLLCIVSVMFWAFYFQMFLSLTLFISRVVQPRLFGIIFPAPYYVAVQSLGMILIGLLLARRHKKHSGDLPQASSANNKFFLAILSMCVAYLMITLVAKYSLPTALLSPLLIIPSYLIISLAELLISPVGLSIITVLASPKRVSTMMGIFFVSLGMGGFLSGKLAILTAVSSTDISTEALKLHYAQSFTTLSLVLLGFTVLCAVLHQVIKRLLRA